MSKIIDGKAISGLIKEELKIEVDLMKAGGKSVSLTVIQVGDDKASSVYVKNKQKACEYIGIDSDSINLPETTTQSELLELIRKLNNDNSVHGILVQLPLPNHISADKVLLEISPDKDVDGFHPFNVGMLYTGASRFTPCTPAGMIELLKRSNIEIEGKKCVVVGRSNIVGKPVAQLMLNENATVTIAHSRTKDLKSVTRNADILIVAIGIPKFITDEYVSEGTVVIDVGIHRGEDNKLCGDVDFDSVYDKVAAITPVPGGVGPMTISMLMNNCVIAANNREVC